MRCGTCGSIMEYSEERGKPVYTCMKCINTLAKSFDEAFQDRPLSLEVNYLRKANNALTAEVARLKKENAQKDVAIDKAVGVIFDIDTQACVSEIYYGGRCMNGTTNTCEPKQCWRDWLMRGEG